MNSLLALATGNFPTVTRVLLAKIPSQDGKMTYVYDEYVFHYVVEGGICYLCMSDEKNKVRQKTGLVPADQSALLRNTLHVVSYVWFTKCVVVILVQHRIPFAFLQDVKQLFLTKYGHETPQTAIAFAMNEEFSPMIRDRMDFYNSEDADRSIDNIGAVKSQIDEVKDVMVQNIEKVRN